MRRITRVLVPTLALAASVLLAPTAARATTFDVFPGQSIQAAIDSAPPGSTIHVHAGTYRESLFIQKDGLHLIGDGDNASGTILKPPRSSNNPCADSASAFPGICIAGQFDSSGNLTGPTSNVEVAGFLVRNFPSDGIISFGASTASIHNDTAATNAGYGITSFVSSGNVYDSLNSHDNGEPGFYIGDSPTANFTLTNSKSINNAMGILVREANTGDIANNEFAGNCVGIFVLNTGGPPDQNPRVTDWNIHNNLVHDNSKSCPGDEEEPPVQGSGILLAGPKDVTVDSNIVQNNLGPSDNPLSGGINLLSSANFGGNNPVGNTISNNTATGNTPYDILWDKTGKENSFVNNTCNTSKPSWICA